MTAQPDLTVVIPVYNEQKTLEKILEKVGQLPLRKFEIIVVDDASKDKSPDIIKRFFKKHNKLKHTIITHGTNKGKGAGIKSALEVAKGKYFVVQDADLEYEPSDIVPLLEYAISHKQEVVYGSRFLGSIKNMPRPNYIANIFYNLLLKILYGVKMTDMHTCYKMVKTDLMRDLHMTSDGFDYATELVSKLLRRKKDIKELPISFNGRTKREGKKINLMDGLECLYKLVAYRFAPTDDMFQSSGVTTIRFMIVGLLGFLVNYLVLVFFSEVLQLSHLAAEIIAMAVALQVTFLLHDNWTYRVRVKKGQERLSIPKRYAAFISSNLLGGAVTVIVFSVLYNVMLRSVALFIAAMAGLVWNYVANKYVTWRPALDTNKLKK